MRYTTLREEAYEANLELNRRGMVIYTWGNVSCIDRDAGVIAIKPSGVRYEELRVEDIVVLDLYGERVEGTLRPSSDTPTHLVLYRRFESIGGVVHTHSTYATAWAQAGRAIPCLGTTHADYFYGEVPCTQTMTAEQVAGEYEHETGEAIVRAMEGKNARFVPATLVRNHGPFTWGKDAHDAVHNAVVLEEVARMAMITLRVATEPLEAIRAPESLIEKHFSRKHGANAYYGQ